MRWFDVAVVGAGPAGCAVAALARRTGRTVALVHRPTAPAVRGETVSPMAAELCEATGLREILGEAGAVRSAGVVDGWCAGRSPVFRPSVLSALGPAWHVDRARLDEVARDRAAAAGAQVVVASVRAVDRGEAGFALTTTGEAVGCATLVDASGRSAVVSRLLGLPLRILDRQLAIAAELDETMDEPALHLASCPAGWLYRSPLPGGGTQVALLTDKRALDRGPPAQLLQRTLEALNVTAAPRRVRAVAVVSRVLAAAPPAGLFVVGDAAWQPDPLSGQGVARALDSAWRLADADFGTRAGGNPVSPERAALRHMQLRDRWYQQTPFRGHGDFGGRAHSSTVREKDDDDAMEMAARTA
jgi:flavin-dependent dehydrogenase